MPYRHAPEWTRRAAVSLVALASLGLTIIGLANRLAYTRPPQHEFLALAAGNEIWVPLHFATFLMLATAIGLRHAGLTWFSLNLAFATIGAWSFLTLLWGLWPVGPVSLAGPVLGIPFAILAHFMAYPYSRINEIQRFDRRHHVDH